MPIIRQSGGFFGNAGEGVAQTRSANAQTRDSALRLDQRRQQEELRRIQLAHQADAQIQDRARRDQEIALRQQQQDRLDAQVYANGQAVRPITGQGILENVAQIQSMSPEAFAQLEQRFDALTGGAFGDENPATPEALDGHPAKAAIWAEVTAARSSLESQLDQQAVQAAADSLLSTVERLDPQWSQGVEGQEFLGAAMARLSDPDLTGAEAQHLAGQLRGEAARMVGLNKDRESYMRRAEDMIDEYQPGYDEPDHRGRAREMAAQMLTSDNPLEDYLRVTAVIDPERRLLSQMAEAEGRKAGALSSLVQRARHQDAAVDWVDPRSPVAGMTFDVGQEPTLEQAAPVGGAIDRAFRGNEGLAQDAEDEAIIAEAAKMGVPDLSTMTDKQAEELEFRISEQRRRLNNEYDPDDIFGGELNPFAPR